VEGDAFAELHREPLAALGKLPRFCELGRGLVLPIEADQGIVEGAEHRPIAQGKLGRIEVQHIGGVGITQDAALLDSLGARDPRGAEPRQPRRDRARFEEFASRKILARIHGCSLLR
jgi:hypothetical protein